MIHKVAFDLDGTLAHSKSAISDTTAKLLIKLLDKHHVAIITGASLEQLKKQYIPIMERNYRFHYRRNRTMHYLFTASGARCDAAYLMQSYGNSCELSTTQLFQFIIPSDIKNNIISILNDSIEKLFMTLNESPTIYGNQIEDRTSQITLSTLGQQAPLNDKIAWDPTGNKRKLLKSIVELKLKESNLFDLVDARLGGLTSIDITNKNINKKSAIQYFASNPCMVDSIKEENVMYFGDALYEGGNDHIVTETGAVCVQTISPDMTNHLIQTLFDL